VNDFYRKLAGLSPERRALFEKKLAEHGLDASSQPAVSKGIPLRPEGLDSLPLSFAQRRLWFMQQLEPESTAYNMLSVLRLRGPLDRVVLGRALDEVVARHETLRTRFILGPDNEPRQIIGPAGPVAIDDIDMAGRADAEAAGRARIEALAAQPFDLTRAPLRVLLVRLAAEDHLLAIATHHIASDRWSVAVLVRELSALYRAGLSGEASPLPPVKVQFADWALWQRDRLQGARLQTQLDYWMSRLGGELPLLGLPFDRPRGASARFEGAHFPVRLDSALSLRLRDLARRQGVSLFTLLLAAYKVFLHRYTDTDDIVVGSDVANRDRAETQGMIGPLVNTLVLRSDLSGDPAFEAVLSQVNDVVRGGLAHQDVPFERVVEAVNPERRLGEMTPLFQAKLDFQHVTVEAAAPDGVRLERYPLEARVAKFELRFNLEDVGSDIGGKIEYATSLFDEATIARLWRNFGILLDGIAADPARPISALPLISAEEEKAILQAGLGPGFEQPAGICIHTLFEAQAARTPDAPAVTDGRATLTYRELNAKADAIAAALAAKGAALERCIGVCMRREPSLVAALLGVLKAGGAYVPLDPDYPAERLALIAEDAELDIVISDTAELPFAPGRPLTVVDPENLPAGAKAVEARPSPDNLAYIIYTSGSTGRPKGVALAHRNAVARLTWAREQFSAEELSGVLAGSSVSFDLSVFEIFAPLAWGGRVVLADNLLALPRLPANIGITLLNSVPSLLRELIKHQELPASLRTITLAGEIFPTGLLETLQARYPSVAVYNLWGPSEDTTFSSCTPVTHYDTQRGPLPIGDILPGTRTYILDRAGKLLPQGAVGEIHLGGSGLARGYLRREELTRETFLPDPIGGAPGERLYKTGDRGRWRPDGLIDFAGRVDNQVKLRGFRIETGEIEHYLEQQKDIHQAAVIVTGSPGDPNRQLIGYVVPRPGARVEEGELRDRLARSLPAHFVPARLCTLAEMPTMPNGKIDRKALPIIAPLGVQAAYAAPQSETEARLARLWSEVLGVERVGIKDNFFALGGHSLLAIQIIARIDAEFGVALPLRALFESPTVAGLARRLASPEEKPAGAARPPLAPDSATRFDPFPLTDIQHAYWMGRNRAFELGSIGSHSYREYDVEGLDMAAAEVALRQLIARHDMLRAVVGPDGQQRILETVPAYEIAVADLRGASDAEARLSAIRDRLSHHVFAPERWPLFHIEAARLSDDTTRVFVSFDVLIGDAWSFQLLGEEFAALMSGGTLPPLTLTFRDYVAAERAREQSPAYAAAWEHWRKRLDNLPPAPELPLARSPSQIETPRFARRSTRLAPADWAAFKERASTFGLTPTSAVLAAFSEVLARWCRRPAFTVNLTIFNRHPVHPEVNQIVGDFTASLLLGIDMAGIGSFGERAKRLQDRLWEDLDYRAVSGVRVLRELTRRQNRSSSALMPVVFTSTLTQTAPQERERSFTRTLVNSVSQTPQVYLDHQASEIDGALVCNWDAIEELFPAGLLDEMFAAYERLLSALARDETAWRSNPELTDGAHFEALNCAAVLPLAGSDRLLHDPFFSQAARNPDRIAIIGNGAELTYGQLAGRALALAAELQAHGALPNDLVAISLERGPAQIIACLGVLASGAAYVPIDPDLPRERRWQLIEDTQARLAVCAGGDWPQGLRCIAVPDRAGAKPKPAGTQATDLAYVIFTSGSTGRPKGVMIDHRGAVNTVLDIIRRFSIGRDDRVFAISALSFDLSVYDIFGPLTVGGAVVVPNADEAVNTARWRELLTRHRVTVWNSVPALAQLLFTELGGDGDQPPLRLVMMSGDWIPVSLPGMIRSCLPSAQVISLGGATEASVWSIFYPVETVAPDWASIPYGYPLANQRWYVLDDEMRPCPPWVTGRLFIGGVGVARGYWARAALTAEKFVPDPFATAEEAASGALHLYDTGDLGRYRGDGALEFLGREDFQLKINGFRIELGEIEANLLQHPAVAEAVVAAAGSPPSLVGYVVPHFGGGEAALRFDLKAQQAGLRPAQSEETRLVLPEPEAVGADLMARQSHRRFLSAPVPMEKLGGLLAALRSVSIEGAPLAKYAYPSAGSLYPVQTYLWAGEGRVAGLERGWYYYHPARHDLLAISGAAADTIAGSNDVLIRDSAFSLFMVASARAMTELYGGRARDFSMLEAGYMGQLLMTRAPALGIGLCPLGGIDMGALRGTLALGDDHIPLHALAGGSIDPAWNESWQAATPTNAAGFAEKLGDFLAERLPAHMVPRDILLLDKLPLTANGKVDRHALPRPGTRQRAPISPANAAEVKVLELWRELLDAPELGVEDQFFEAGGNSLTAMRLLTRLQQDFAVELSIAQLFGALTPRAQAALVASARVRPPGDVAPIQAVARHADTAALGEAVVDDMLARLLAEGETAS
jgi:amino acid adenylation domain-containing protein